MAKAKPQLEELDQRAVSAAFELGRGVVRLRETPIFDEIAFPGWEGGLSVLVEPQSGQVWVGAGPGGGPRVRVWDVKSPDPRLIRDYFAGDPESRAGIVLVDPSVQNAQNQPFSTVPSLEEGDPAWFSVFVDYDPPALRDRVDPVQFIRDSFAPLAGLFPGLPIHFTTERPALPAGDYGTVVVGAPTSWYEHSAGYAPGVFNQTKGDFMPQQVYVAGSYAPGYTARIMAHEIGHALGLGHTMTSPADPVPTPMDGSGNLGASFTSDQLVFMGPRLRL